MTVRRVSLVCALALCVHAAPARAQLYESVGIRAQGLAGAFVAVADDATATWWNPAGLNSGPFVDAIVEYRGGIGEEAQPSWGVAVMVPSLGLSYYGLRVWPPASSGSTGPLSGDRQDGRTGGTRLPPAVLNQFGATVGISVGDHIVLGSTVSLVQADQVRGDLDVGVMGTFGSARAAVVVKRVVLPDLTSDGHPMGLERQVRIGAAVAVPPRGQLRMTASVDADLTVTPTAAGDERHIAGGFEAWVTRFLGVRGGVSFNTIADARPSASVGASAVIRSRFFVDAQVTGGQDVMTKGWGLGARVTF